MLDLTWFGRKKFLTNRRTDLAIDTKANKYQGLGIYCHICSPIGQILFSAKPNEIRHFYWSSYFFFAFAGHSLAERTNNGINRGNTLHSLAKILK